MNVWQGGININRKQAVNKFIYWVKKHQFAEDKSKNSHEIFLPPSVGEIHYLWWYIQGSIMNPATRRKLHNAWGFCERHAWIAMLVEASLRHCFLMGPALVYEELMRFAQAAMSTKGLMKNLRAKINICKKGPCLMCDMNLGPFSPGYASDELVARSRDNYELRRFAQMTKPYWENTACGHCAGNGSWLRCRAHLVEDYFSGQLENIKEHYDFINYVKTYMASYYRSFRWECRKTVTGQDKAALISASAGAVVGGLF